MKSIISIAVLLIIASGEASAQQTINFNQFPSQTVITNQYQSNGVIFEGLNGSNPPSTYDYSLDSLPYGKILHGDGWFNGLKIKFVNPSNPNSYQLASALELDNLVDSSIAHSDEIDFMSINVYDSTNNLLYHYLSRSPEHVTISLGSASIAYVTIDDSANTSFVLDNIMVNSPKLVSLSNINEFKSSLYPNPFSEQLTIEVSKQGSVQVSIFDVLSREVLSSKFTNSTTLNTEFLQSGVYTYQIIDENGSVSKGKVIKQ